MAKRYKGLAALHALMGDSYGAHPRNTSFGVHRGVSDTKKPSVAGVTKWSEKTEVLS